MTDDGIDSQSDADELRVATLSVPEMDCASCAGKVTKSVGTLRGVDDIDPQVATGRLAVTYDAEATSVAAIEDRVEAAGYGVESDARRQTAQFRVPEMDCASCAGKVENALDGVDGIAEYDTQPTTGRVVVTYDADAATRTDLTDVIEGAGYPVAEAENAGDDAADIEPPSDVWTSTRALKTGVGGVLLVLGLVFEFLLPSANALLFDALGRPFHVASVLFLFAAAVSGVEVLRNGYYSFKTLNLDIDLLMSGGILGALAVGLYTEAATLAVLFSVAELMERYSMDRARHSLRELMELSADEATVKRDGEELTVPVEDVHVGDTVLVRPGEKIPMDGTVSGGETSVNQAPITGESVPVDKTAGDEVFAGTINETGYLEIEVTSEAQDSTLSRIIRLVEDAQGERTDREQFVDRFASYYTPVVVAGAILTAALPPLLFGGPWRVWFVRGLTLLVISCPCAFVISTPVSVVSGVTSAARNGVLIKGGNYLEAMGAVETVAFDKTGTLTRGELAVTDVVPLNDNTEGDVLQCARALETRSEHPIATAIVEYADERGVPDRAVSAFESLTGKGVSADLDGETHYAGNPALFEELGFDLEHTHATDGGRAVAAEANCERGGCLNLRESTIPDLQREGKTLVLVGTEDRLEGVIAIADEVRPDAKRTVERLREQGVERVVMLTGDNERTASVIADEVGVDEFRAGLLPEEKVEVLDDLAADGDVAMVGDGINDAPALAAATVGVAMGAAGTDTALETADIALMGDDLSKLPYLHALSRKANSVIRENIWSSLAVKALLALGVPFGYVSVAAAIVVGDMGMSLGVTGNAMRLAHVTPDDD